MNVLRKLIDFAAFSKDVRVLHRCLTIYTKTELKFTDIMLDLSNAVNAFSPDALGLSEVSLANSGSAEMAAKAREGIVSALVEWGSMKKGDLMVGPLSQVLQFLLLFASAYPQFEETYTQMMKPIARLLVDKKMQWSSSVLSSYSGTSTRKSLLTTQKGEHCPIFEAEKRILQSWSNMELFMRGKLPRIDAKCILLDSGGVQRASHEQTLPCFPIGSAERGLGRLAGGFAAGEAGLREYREGPGHGGVVNGAVREGWTSDGPHRDYADREQRHAHVARAVHGQGATVEGLSEGSIGGAVADHAVPGAS